MQNILEIDSNLTKIIQSLRDLLAEKDDEYLEKQLEKFIQHQIELYQVLPNTRQDALTSKQKYYFTGKPCLNSHFRMRRTSNAGCLSCG